MSPAAPQEILLRFPYRRPAAEPRARLFCFPHAGGTAATFRAWVGQAGPDLDICPVQYPGRERLIREPFPDSLRDLAELCATFMQPLLDRPFMLFGHSMGGLVAFEVARQLARTQGGHPVHLFIATCAPPDTQRAGARFASLPDDRFLERASRVFGIPAMLLDDPEMRDLLLPRLRADFGMFDRYRIEDQTPLDIPMSIFAGARDHLVPPSSAHGWHRWTRRGCREHVLDAGHFLVSDARDDILREVQSVLSAQERGLPHALAPHTPPVSSRP
jgi:medium-chain acyl-[acyl-carrier-protein] hydrolase